MSKVELTINGQAVVAQEGQNILQAAEDAGIFIPHLCADDEIDHHPGACRLCFVEIEGREQPVLSCLEKVQPGMTVQTRSQRVDKLVASAFELLMSVHRLDCKDCPSNKHCGLQTISKRRKLPLRPKRLNKIEPDWPIDDSHPRFGMNPNHCVLCGKCVKVSNDIIGTGVLDFSGRGLDAVISTFDGAPLAEQDLTDFEKCVEVCPVGALYLKE